MGFANPLRMAITPAIKVVETAPNPGVSTPSFPLAGAIFTLGILFIKSLLYFFSKVIQVKLILNNIF
jgi:hypothetical protein